MEKTDNNICKVVLNSVWDDVVALGRRRDKSTLWVMECQRKSINAKECINCKNQYIVCNVPMPTFCKEIKDDYF